MKKLILFFYILALPVFSQVEHSSNEFAQSTLVFYIDYASYPTGDSTKTRFDIFLKVPYSKVQFIRSENGFVGKYTFTITIYDEEQKNIIIEKFWNESLETRDFAQAISENNYNYSYKSFELNPKKYFLRIELYDKDSKSNSVYKGPVMVRNFNTPVQLSDLIFVSEKVNSVSGDQYVPLVSNKLTSNDTLVTFVYEVYSDTSKSSRIEYQVFDQEEKNIYSNIEDVTLKKGRNSLEHVIKNPDLSLGDYKLVVRVRDVDWKIEAERTKKFVSRIFGFPPSIVNLDDAIDQMTYIAGAGTLDEIRDAENYVEKLHRYRSFWKLKDPSPETEKNEILNEYYRRVDYANANFKNYFDGWRTDMGMIYIILGPPNNVERHPFDLENKPYEVWDYYDINKQFVFIDQTGFGDYRLLNQQYGEWYRYRQ